MVTAVTQALPHEILRVADADKRCLMLMWRQYVNQPQRTDIKLSYLWPAGLQMAWDLSFFFFHETHLLQQSFLTATVFLFSFFRSQLKDKNLNVCFFGKEICILPQSIFLARPHYKSKTTAFSVMVSLLQMLAKHIRTFALKTTEWSVVGGEFSS